MRDSEGRRRGVEIGTGRWSPLKLGPIAIERWLVRRLDPRPSHDGMVSFNCIPLTYMTDLGYN